VQLVQEPPEELDRVPLLGDAEPAAARVADLLEELVRADLGLELARVPQLAREHAEPAHELRRALRRGERVENEVVAQGRDVQEEVQGRVHEAVVLHVVEADEAGEVRALGEVERGREGRVDALEELRGEARVQERLDVGERRVVDLVAVGQDKDLLRLEVDEDVVVVVEGVRVGRRRLAAPLEVLAVDEARVDVVVRERDRAQALKVEVEGRAVDLRGARQSQSLRDRR